MVCNTLTKIPRVEFTKISFRNQDRFRLLGTISHLEQEGDKLELVRGCERSASSWACWRCLSRGGQSSFAARGAEIALCAKKILHLVMNVTNRKGEEDN